MTKLHAIVSNADYFKLIILEFKTFIYNSNSKIIHTFCMCGSDTASCKEKVPSSGGEKNFNSGITREH